MGTGRRVSSSGWSHRDAVGWGLGGLYPVVSQVGGQREVTSGPGWAVPKSKRRRWIQTQVPVKEGGRAEQQWRGARWMKGLQNPAESAWEGHGEQGGGKAGLQVNSSSSPSFTLSLPFSILSAFSQELAEVGREIFPFYSALKHSMQM